MDGLFILGKNGDVILENKWDPSLTRYVLEEFHRQRHKAKEDEHNVCPIIKTPRHVLLISSYSGLFFVGVTAREVSPAMVFAVFDSIYELLEKYLRTNLSSRVISDNLALVYQLLDEIFIDGRPFLTDFDHLRNMVPVPGTIEKIMHMVGASDSLTALASAAVSQSVTTNSSAKAISPPTTHHQKNSVPWRSEPVEHQNNELLFDVIETINAIVQGGASSSSSSSSNNFVSAEIFGEVVCKCHLSGMPEVEIKLSDAEILSNVSFHKSVQLFDWEKNKSIALIPPPDGTFVLAKYFVDGTSRSVALPMQVNISSAPFSVKVKPLTEKQIDDVSIEFDTGGFCARNVRVSAGKQTTAERSVGRWTVIWTIGKLKKNEATLELKDDEINEPRLVRVKFSCAQHSMSGFRLSRVGVLKMPSSRKPYKGVKYVSRSDRFEVRRKMN